MDLFFPEQTNHDVCSTWKSLQIKKKKKEHGGPFMDATNVKLSTCQKSNVHCSQKKVGHCLTTLHHILCDRTHITYKNNFNFFYRHQTQSLLKDYWQFS